MFGLPRGARTPAKVGIYKHARASKEARGKAARDEKAKTGVKMRAEGDALNLTMPKIKANARYVLGATGMLCGKGGVI